MTLKKEKLGKLCDITSSKRIFYAEYVESGVPFYRSKEIIELESGQDISESLYISETKYESIKSKFGTPSTSDMLLTSVGTIGIPYIVKDSDRFYFKDGNLTWFRNFNKELYSKFLYFWIKSPEGQATLYNLAIGSSQKALTIAMLKEISIPLPLYAVQQKIADILSAYDDLIENNQKQIKLLEEAAQRLYKEWFVDFRFPGHEHTKIIDGLPEGWKRVPLFEVFDYVRGKSYTSKELSNEGTILVNLKNIRAYGGYNIGAEKYYSGVCKHEHILKHGDLVMGVTDMTQERRLVGQVAIIPNLENNATFSMDLIKLIPKCVTKNYLYTTMYYGGYSRNISVYANGVNVLHLKPESIMNMMFIVPDRCLMTKFDSIFDNYHCKIEVLQKQNQNAAQARDMLLPKLMSGEIAV